MRELWRHRAFRLLLAGQTLSMFGDWTMLLVFGIWAKSLTGSNAVAGAMLFAVAAPGLVGPLGGVLADRMPRRRLMIALNLASVPAVLALWLVHDGGQLWLLVTVAVWYGASSNVFNAAMAGFVQWLLPAELVGPANGSLATVRQALRVVGPFVGAGLFAVAGGAWVATIDAATFVMSAVALLAVRCSEPARTRHATRLRAELAAGVAHLRRNPDLRRVTVLTVVTAIAFGPLEAGIFALADGLHRPPTFLGVLACVQGLGAVVGGTLVTASIRRTAELRLIGVGLLTASVGTALMAVPILPTAVAGFAVFGAGLPIFTVAVATLLQHRTPNTVMSRTSSAYEVANSVPFTLTIALGSVLVTRLPYQVIFGASAAATMLAAALAFRAARSSSARQRSGRSANVAEYAVAAQSAVRYPIEQAAAVTHEVRR